MVYATGTGFDDFGNIAVINIIQVFFALSLIAYYAGAIFHGRAILQAFKDHGEDAHATLVSQRMGLSGGKRKHFVFFSTVQFDAVAAVGVQGSAMVTKEFSTQKEWNGMHSPGTTIAVKYMRDDPRMCIVTEFLNNPNAHDVIEMECQWCCMIFFPLPVITPAFWCYGAIL
jgi:hypothetical protein